MGEKAKPGFHRCISMQSHMEIATFGNSATLSLEGQGIRLAIEIHACPVCLEPFTPTGRTLGRMKRVEGLK